MDGIEDTEQTCIIVVDFIEDQNAIQMGIIVDSVSEVLNIDVNDIDDPPRFGAAVNTSFIHGIAKTNDGVKILLKIEDVLTTDEIHGLTETVDEAL
jgi:purine-binding chemotaxis protein CheW